MFFSVGRIRILLTCLFTGSEIRRTDKVLFSYIETLELTEEESIDLRDIISKINKSEHIQIKAEDYTSVAIRLAYYVQKYERAYELTKSDYEKMYSKLFERVKEHNMKAAVS